MPSTLRQTRPTKQPTDSYGVADSFYVLELETHKKWRQWVKEMSTGGKPPTPREILEAAAILQIVHPGQSLEQDVQAAQAVVAAATLEAESDKAFVEFMKPWSGHVDGIHVAIAAGERKLRELKNTLYRYQHWPRNQHRMAVEAARKNNPRLFEKETA